MRHAKFENVQGYATYQTAERRGQHLAEVHPEINARWLVIALPNGRFAPCVVCNEAANCAFLVHCGVCVVN